MNPARYTPKSWARHPAALLLCLLSLLLGTSARAAESRFDVWTTDNGLPQNSVYSIIQTRDGYVWFTTFGGLVRYDGVRFTVFDKSNSAGLDSSRFTALCEGADGTLWAGTEKNGVVRYDVGSGSFRTYTIDDGLPNNKVRAINAGPAGGDVWVYTDGGVARWDGARFAPPAQGAAPTAAVVPGILAMRERNTGAAYFDAAGLHRFVNGELKTYAAREGLHEGAPISGIYEDQRGTLWVETKDRRLYRLQNGRLVAHPITNYAPAGAGEMTLAYEDRGGDLWVATRRGQLCRWRGGQIVETFTTRDGLSSDQIETVFEDREGNLWFGAYNNGLNRLREQSFAAYSGPQGLWNVNVYPVLEDLAGDVWVGTWGGGLGRFREGRFERVPFAGLTPGKPDEVFIGALHADVDGSLWVGTFGGSLVRLHEGRATRYQLPGGPDNKGVRAIYRDRAGRLWVGTTDGLMLFRDGQFNAYRVEQGLPHREVNVILEDREGALWVGTLGGLARFRDGRFTNYTEREGLLSNNVRALYEDGDGVLWVGSYDGGLNRFAQGRFTSYSARDGLFDNGVFQILEDDAGNLWMSCNRGVFRVSRAEMNDFAEGRRRSVTSIYYGKRDGLLNIECNGGAQPSGWRARDGSLWFPTQDGLAVVNPASAKRSTTPPPVALEEFTLGDRDVLFRGAAEIPAGVEQFSINYTGLSFINPEQVKFKYKLEGLDDDWVDAGSRRTAYYSHVPPGAYTFRVIAANSDGVWNTEGALIRVNVVPRFYRTWWFLALSVAGLLGAAAFAYRRRVARLERRQAKQEAFARALIASQEGERKRIAAELHDGLGQNLLVIKNRALMALRAGGGDDLGSALRQVDEISATAAQAIEEVREIAYNLRPYQLDRLGLTKAVEAMTRRMASASGVEFSVALDSLDNLFPEEDEINLFRVVQESVNNVVKHSGAARASLKATRAANTLRVEVSDDGRGFVTHNGGAEGADSSPSWHVAAEVAPAGGGGFGLRNVSERVRILGGTHHIKSAPGQGTTVTFLFDLKRARHKDGN